ncbi:hypothetical protein [Tritonibacter sp. SIMBA_163]|uniref:hypothetical protein n=1 Tax=Tritonibacter sp. SIMBA_163 TaxID=3080868 RepID=UPI00397F6217
MSDIFWLRMHDEGSRNDPKAFENIWSDLNEIVGHSRGPAEFPMSLIDEIVGRISSMSPESESLDKLTETLSEFTGQREQAGLDAQNRF